MRTSSRAALLLLSLALGSLELGCGKEIGDACAIPADCSPNGDRQCDIASNGGYCTIQGCDWNTCPDGSVCVRFYATSFSNRPCNLATEDLSTDDCSLDEACSLEGQCVPQTSEVRYCMKTCDSNDDCRDRYECRDEALMIMHGGEPVPKTGERLGDNLQKFCAAAPQ